MKMGNWSVFMGGAFVLLVIVARAHAQDASEFFESRVRPVLVNNCSACHANSQLGGLRLDSREAVLKGGKSGPAIVPGKPEESRLVVAINQPNAKLRMPLGGRLKDNEIADLTKWVKMGAPWPSGSMARAPDASGPINPRHRQFWSFQPLRNPPPPPVINKSWPKNEIDRFVLSELEKRRLKPAQPADKRTLLRRATLDLTGLPPTPEEVEVFLSDSSRNAFEKVVDRLLVSPQYGVRWARFWLDVARYGEDDIRGSVEPPKPVYPNAWRYRDWVIDAFNNDMPFQTFVKAQIAADLLPGTKDELLAGLGFLGLGPWYYDTADPRDARANERNDRVDAITRGFLGLTVACARCHDHKYDPITIRDYYGLAGVFANTEYAEVSLDPQNAVTDYKSHQRKITGLENAIQRFLETQTAELGEIEAHQTSACMKAAWKIVGPQKLDQRLAAEASDLDAGVLEKWVKYLGNSQKDHRYLEKWEELLARAASADEILRFADEFQSLVLAIIAEKKAIDEDNQLLIAQANPEKKKFGLADESRLLPNRFSSVEDYCVGCNLAVKFIARDKFVLWRDLFAPRRRLADNVTWTDEGVFYFGEANLERFLSGPWKKHLDSMRAQLDALKNSSPPPYAYLHAVQDVPHATDLKLHLRGSPYNLGDETPRRFVEVLSGPGSGPFSKGSGRLELADAIAAHPLSARVMANRIWAHHFGNGIVGTLSNFGQVGERPTHPELLEYLATELRTTGSLKSLQRDIMLSATYQLGNEQLTPNLAADPENRLLWRANRRRLDVEAIRDSLLFVSGNLDLKVGGPSTELTDGNNRRTIYGKVSRVKTNELLALFDFPDPSASSERRNVTNVPLQRLFFMNSDFMARLAIADEEHRRCGRHKPSLSAAVRQRGFGS